MADEIVVVGEEMLADEADASSLSFKEFLERTPPATEVEVTGLWAYKYAHRVGNVPSLTTPQLRLHCQTCEGVRTFRSEGAPPSVHSEPPVGSFFLNYTCGDCHKQHKRYSIFVRLAEEGDGGTAFKYGELPPFGIPVANAVLRLFGKEAPLFMKGRQCENLGFGVAAFAYYRRVVENHKNDIIEAIIKVCQTLNVDHELIAELKDAKSEISFQKSVEHIKAGIPQGLLINGHNPLEALHGALSVGLHNESDEECLAAASAVRLVLTDLTEKIASLRQENRELHGAVQLLLAKRSKSTT